MIRRGDPWGELVDPPAELIDVASDAEAATLADSDQVRLTGGDLLMSLGGPTTGSHVARFHIDLLRVTSDVGAHVAIAHVIARRRSWWHGPIAAAFNVDRLGNWDAAPRAHPGDGLLDVIEVGAEMSFRDRWQARRRLPTGTHVPHPTITTRRARAVSWTFDAPRRLWVDGERCGFVRSLEVVVEPGAATVHT